MKKLVRDGKVAVLISKGFGAGWYSWHKVKELIFDPDVVKMVELDWPTEGIVTHCEKFYGSDNFYGGVNGLSIQWITEGKIFRIDEYDGSESIITQSEDEWIIA
jgi:hypothetical protein